jgi:hypothetical protein
MEDDDRGFAASGGFGGMGGLSAVEFEAAEAFWCGG